MPDTQKPCPVVAAYVAQSKKQLDGAQSSVKQFLYDAVYDELDQVVEHSKDGFNDKVSSDLRAFHCLHQLLSLLRRDPRTDMPPLTREGINGIIELCAEARDDEKVKIVVAALSPDDRTATDWRERSAQVTIDLCDVVVEAAKYLRPRLHNGKSMSGMGRYLAQGLGALLVPTDRFIEHGRRLNTISINHKGGLDL